MAKKIRFGLFILITVLFSCKSDLFTHRHYRSGFYREVIATAHKHDLKNENPVTVEQAFQEIRPCVKPNPVRKLAPASSLNASLLRNAPLKDSIIITRKRGKRHIRQVFQNNNNFDVLVIKREGHKDIIRKERAERLKLIYEFKPLVIIALILSIFPVIGLIISLHAVHRKKELLKYNEKKVVNESRERLIASIVISLTINILIVLLLIFLIFVFVTGIVVGI